MTDSASSTPVVTPQNTPTLMRNSVEQRISRDLISQLEHMDAANRFMVPKTRCVTDLDNAVLRHDVQQPGCTMTAQPNGIECCELRTNNPNQFDDYDFAKKCVELQQFYNTVVADRGLADYLEKIKDYFGTIHEDIEHERTENSIPIIDFSDCSHTTIDNIIDVLTAMEWNAQEGYRRHTYIVRDARSGHRSLELATKMMIDNTLSCITYDSEMLLNQLLQGDYAEINVHQIPAATTDENSDTLSRAMIAISNIVEMCDITSGLENIHYAIQDCIKSPAVLPLHTDNVRQLAALVLVLIRNTSLQDFVIRLEPVTCSQKMTMLFLKIMSDNADICDEGTMRYLGNRTHEQKITYSTEVESVFIRFNDEKSLCTITKYREEEEDY